MNKTAAALLVASLAVGGSASAAERAPSHQMDGANHLLDLQAKIFRDAVNPPAPKAPPPPQCMPIAQLRSDYADKTHLTVLTPGQFHFVEGMYVGSPFTPHGLPPGDGALMVEVEGHAGIVWTRGKQACITVIAGEDQPAAYMPMPVDKKLVEAVKTGKDETTNTEDTSKDLHL